MALGIAVAGSGVGGFVLSPAIQASIAAVGLSWTLRILAFVSYAIVLVAICLIRIPKVAVQSERKPAKMGKQLKILKDVRFLSLFFMGLIVSLGYLVPFFLMPCSFYY